MKLAGLGKNQKNENIAGFCSPFFKKYFLNLKNGNSPGVPLSIRLQEP